MDGWLYNEVVVWGGLLYALLYDNTVLKI